MTEDTLTGQAVSGLGKGTLVRMADFTDKPIEEIEPGDIVLGRQRLYALCPARVVRVHDRGLRPCYRYIFRTKQQGYFDIVCTPDYRFLARVIRKVDGTDEETVHNGLIPIGTLCVSYGVWSADTLYQNLLDGCRPLVSSEYVGAYPVYNLEVKIRPHLFVLNHSVIAKDAANLCKWCRAWKNY